MHDLDWPGSYGQENDPPCPPDPSETPRRRKSGALMLSDDEAKAVRIAVRKLRRAFGSFNALAARLNMPANTVRRIANPKGTPPTGTFAIRLAAVAGVPVEVLLGGKLVVTTPVIGRAA
ncbi:helix-turn-helix domain-containing protein [Polyangium sorediatum]|uniref:Helix-turn-helix transcriptional regulator n=1 Tax=Polyangium sorediatum TaxID=889274 RepID=A0ABT6P562_9BACT|nr:helix-turn-helix transcriptional regulator [Polyangium sorediatum]MDI1435452.1 helix-turn-helix transcriptional regulator [Polyangium sorediatum]